MAALLYLHVFALTFLDIVRCLEKSLHGTNLKLKFYLSFTTLLWYNIVKINHSYHQPKYHKTN